MRRYCFAGRFARTRSSTTSATRAASEAESRQATWARHPMLRLCLTAVVMVLSLPAIAAAQEAWPPYVDDPLGRGTGDYLTPWKLLLIWLVFVLWVRTTDWISRDAVEIGEAIDMKAEIWNPIVVLSFFVSFIVCLIVPLFVIGYVLMWLAFLGPFFTYLFMRDGRVTDDQKALTPSGFVKIFLTREKKTKRGKEKSGALSPGDEGPPIDISPQGAATDQDNQSNLLAAKQSPGFITLKEWLADGFEKRANKLILDYSRESIQVRYEIDGVLHNLPQRERETGDVALAVAKKVCNLDMNERRARQDGKFRAKLGKAKYSVVVVSQGTKTGERAILQIEQLGKPPQMLEDVGMRDKLIEDYKEKLADKGIVVVSALPSGGLKTSLAASLNSTDRYLRDFAGLYDSSKAPIPYVENIDLNYYDGAKGETPATTIRPVALKQPDAMVVPELPDADSLDAITALTAEEDKLMITTVRAREACEALMRLLLLKPNRVEEFVQVLSCVMYTRLVRKLCPACKQAYQPQPQLLQKLGLPPDRVPVLHRAFNPQTDVDPKAKEPEPCGSCGGIGFKGRTGIFELLVIDDAMRHAMLHQPRLEVLQQTARKSGHRTLQEEGILLVAKGDTSINELQRVLNPKG